MRTIRDEDGRRDRGGHDPVEVGQARALRETERALLVEIEGEEQWIPKSVIHDDSEVWTTRGDPDEGREGKFVVKEWWAQKEGLA